MRTAHASYAHTATSRDPVPVPPGHAHTATSDDPVPVPPPVEPVVPGLCMGLRMGEALACTRLMLHTHTRQRPVIPFRSPLSRTLRLSRACASNLSLTLTTTPCCPKPTCCGRHSSCTFDHPHRVAANGYQIQGGVTALKVP